MADERKKSQRQSALDYHKFPKPGKLEIRATKPLANGPGPGAGLFAGRCRSLS